MTNNTSTTQETFIKTSTKLAQSTTLNGNQKLFISYILTWQQNNKVCFASNTVIAYELGLTYEGIRSIINRLNKTEYGFFTVIKTTEQTEFGTYISRHQLIIDEDKLTQYLITNKKVIKTPIEIEEIINTPIIKKEVINTPIIKEEIKEIDDLIEVDDDNDYFKELIKPKNKPVELPIKKKSSIDLDFYINNLQTIQQ